MMVAASLERVNLAYPIWTYGMASGNANRFLLTFSNNGWKLLAGVVVLDLAYRG